MTISKLPLGEEESCEEPHATAGNTVEVTPLLATLLNEAALILYPKLALALGVKPALFLAQVLYWLKRSPHKYKGNSVVRFSYSRWQEQFPFITRQTIIHIVSLLEKKAAISVTRTGRVNLIAKGTMQIKEPKEGVFDKYEARLLVFGTLAKEIGLGPAVCLQEIHIRCHGRELTHHVQKSFGQWHSECLMFWSVRHIKRYFQRLIDAGLVDVKKFPGKGGKMNGYRVAYAALSSKLAGKKTMAPVIDWGQSPHAAKAAVANGEFWMNYLHKDGWKKLAYSKNPAQPSLANCQTVSGQ